MPANAYDVIVIGAGHAGIEAASAAARLGCRTAIVTGNLDTIGKMSCNPSIGGMAKGQLAREVDALGGLMGLATDATGIQFRTLALGKGPALWSPRAQCDKAAYAAWMRQALENHENIYLVQGEAWEIRTTGVGGQGSGAGGEADSGTGRSVTGVALRDGRILTAPRVVLTTGTFLRGLMHQGETRSGGGRMGDPAAEGLSASLAALGLRLIRHKTGTPCRIHADSIRWDLTVEQPGDDPPRPFSFLSGAVSTAPWPPAGQLSCWTCDTTPEAHAHIRANLHRAPMYNGQIASAGPRYCPSIEDKVVRFAAKDHHHLFLEPEGRTTKEIYVNGLSTSLPLDVQDAVLAAIPALAGAHVLRYGYAVEYDVVAADQMDHRLACRSIAGLHVAGQINGTSGYEEAAAQGLIAGANAALSLLGRDPLELSRADAYIGVLVDDLVTRQPDEPYRMFTSRAEHRLHLRTDNADRRLTPLAARAGLVDALRVRLADEQSTAIAAVLAATPDDLAGRVAGEGLDFATTTALLPHLSRASAVTAESAWIELRYRGYLERQRTQIEKVQHFRDLALPGDLDLVNLAGLSHEGRATMIRRQPRTVGELGTMPGVSQTDVETLWAHMQARRKRARPEVRRSGSPEVPCTPNQSED
ncbi:MAG: tRNA uridine-5-carboxymethylaminomethyl(34) synthesis enzyme MnmG [Planctomycetes bacterium]|nr:tRNA uridine-5-carboxymethylaminomethyl(34) synthesis enzyme MnmG [Planctomycetota bacterium]